MSNPSLPHTIDQAKKRAYAIKERMTALGSSAPLTHVYELMAAAFGHRNWATMKASMSSKAEQAEPRQEMTPSNPRRWYHVQNPPPSGGAYVVGGYVEDGVLPRHFQWAFANVVLTTEGPSWSHWDQKRKHVPIEYWTEIGPHPEHRNPEERGMVLVDREDMRKLVHALDTVRKEVFGDIGDEPDLLCGLRPSQRTFRYDAKIS